MPGTRKITFDPSRYLSATSLSHKTIHVAAGHVFYAQGDRASFVCYLEAGRAKLIVVSTQGKEATVSLMAVHDFIGEESFAGATGFHAATALAITPCTALKIGHDEMIALLHQEHEFSNMFLKLVLTRARRPEWNARSFLYQLGTIKLVLRGFFDGTRQEAYSGADCESAAAG